MNLTNTHGRRTMDAITIRIAMTPEELQGVILDLRRMQRRAASSWDVETETFIKALEQASIPVTRTKGRVA